MHRCTLSGRLSGNHRRLLGSEAPLLRLQRMCHLALGSQQHLDRRLKQRCRNFFMPTCRSFGRREVLCRLCKYSLKSARLLYTMTSQHCSEEELVYQSTHRQLSPKQREGCLHHLLMEEFRNFHLYHHLDR